MSMKKYSGILTMLVMMLMILAYGIEPLRVGVGSAIDIVLGPLIDLFKIPFFILIVLLSTITGIYSSVLQKYTIDYDRMQDVQARMKEFQKEYREAQLSGDEKRIKKLESKKDRVMKEQLELSQQQFKPMAYIMVITIPIFFWLLYRLGSTAGNLTMPFFGTHDIAAAVLGPMPVWIIWYFICSLTISQVIRKALNIGGI